MQIAVDYAQLIPNVSFGGFSTGKSVSCTAPIPVTQQRKGRIFDVFLGSFAELLVNPKVSEVLKGIAQSDIQLLETHSAQWSLALQIANPIWCLDCLDLEKSDYKEMPGSKGQLIVNIKKCYLCLSKIEGHHLFVVKRWGAWIMSEALKEAIVSCGCRSGLHLREVNVSQS